MCLRSNLTYLPQQPSWRHDGDSYDWRDDLQKAVAIAQVSINAKFGTLVTDVAHVGEEEPEPVEDEHSETRWNELSSSIGTLIQSISRDQHGYPLRRLRGPIAPNT